ncbi:uncharacterized protein [Amphiura filiformis]|uniref:uncharacterized protein n=1 Tax=Amphiura filiformis TaxID=82378 RepID=UPI003B217895
MGDKTVLLRDEERKVNYDTTPRQSPAAITEPNSERGIEPAHIMLITVIASFGIAFSFAPILVSSETTCYANLNILPKISHIVCSLIISVISVVCIVWYMNEKVKTSLEPSTKAFFAEQLKKLPGLIKQFRPIVYIFKKCPALLQIYVFGFGSILVCILIMAESSGEKPLVLAQNIIRFASLVIQIIFFTVFVRVPDECPDLPSWCSWGMPVMIGAQIWLCLIDIAEPLWPDKQDHLDFTKPASDDPTDFFLFLKHSAEPYQEEFTTIAISILYNIWTEVGTNKIGKHIDAADKKGTVSVPEHAEERPMSLKWHALFSSIWALSYIIITTILLHTNNLNKRYTQFERVTIFRSVQTVYYGILLTVVAIYALRQIRLNRTGESPEADADSQCVLLMTAVVVLTFYALRILAAVAEIKHDRHKITSANSTAIFCLFPASKVNTTGADALLTTKQNLLMDSILFIYPVFSILQIWTQTQLLLKAQQTHVQHRSVQISLVYVIGLNIADWMQTGIDLGFYRDKSVTYSSTPILGEFFNATAAEAIRLGVFPFIVLYRFHSAVIAWELIIRGFERKEHERNPELKMQIQNVPMV